MTTLVLAFVLGFVLGAFAVIGYGAYRALNSDNWDDSNVLNWLRLLSHVFIHPEDFANLWYVETEHGEATRRPFSYIAGDELSDNFPVRPERYEKWR